MDKAWGIFEGSMLMPSSIKCRRMKSSTLALIRVVILRRSLYSR